MKDNIKKKIMKSRMDLIFDHVFFGALIMRLELKEDKGAPTMWTDGTRIGYNPDFVKSLKPEELTFVFGHEVLHCAFDHMTRKHKRDHRKWNKACDYAINQILLDSKFTMPEDALYDKKYNGMSAEKIYMKLPEDDSEGEGDGDNNGSDGQGDPGKCGEIRDAEGGASDAEDLSREWKIATTQAAKVASQAGKLAGGLEELVEEIIHPKVDWKSLLRQFVETNAKNDFTWGKRNRRYADVYLPTLSSETLNLVIGIDTSGSVSSEQLQQFISEVNAIAKDFSAEITVIGCDTKVNSVQHFTPYDDVKIKLRGRGGTRFVPVFDQVDKDELTPKGLIYLTDLECNDFGNEPDYPVLWIQSGDSSYAAKPTFGEVVKMD